MGTEIDSPNIAVDCFPIAWRKCCVSTTSFRCRASAGLPAVMDAGGGVHRGRRREADLKILLHPARGTAHNIFYV